MKVIFKRLWNDPVYVGMFAIAGVGIGASFALGWTGEQVGTVCSAIAGITGAEYTRRQISKS